MTRILLVGLAFVSVTTFAVTIRAEPPAAGLTIQWDGRGVITCMHNDFRIGGLAPGQTKHIRGKLYVVPADTQALIRRFQTDFPESM